MGVGKQPSIAELFRAHAAQKAAEEWRGEWAAALLYRPVALVFAPAAIRLSLSPTAITTTSLVMVLALPVLAAFPPTCRYDLIGGVALVVAVLDCLDGAVARATDSVSKRGHYLDFLTDLLFRICLYGAIGLIAARHQAAPVWLGSWAFGSSLLAAAMALAARLCRVYADHLAAPRRGAGFPDGIRAIAFSAISGVDHLLPLIVIVAGIFNAAGWVILWLVFYSTLDLLHTQFAILPSLR